MAGDKSHFQVGVEHSQAGDHESAEVEFTQALVEHPHDAVSLLLRGVSRFELKKWADSEADFTAALEQGAEYLSILPLRAAARLRQRRFRGAAADLVMLVRSMIAEQIRTVAENLRRH